MPSCVYGVPVTKRRMFKHHRTLAIPRCGRYRGQWPPFSIWLDRSGERSGPLSQLALSLISISVYGYLFDPQEWHPTIHHAHYPCPPSSVQDHVERHESHKLDRFPHLGGSVLYQSNRRPRHFVGFRTLAQWRRADGCMPFHPTSIHVSNPFSPTDPAPDVLYRKSGITTAVAAGSGAGILVVGLVAGGIIAALFTRRQSNRYDKTHRDSTTEGMQRVSYGLNNGRPVTMDAISPTTNGPDIGGSQYLVEPFLPHSPTSPAPTSPDLNARSNNSHGHGITQPAPNVIVVHQDGGRVPNTVFNSSGSGSELPPTYVRQPENQPPTRPTFDPSDRRSRPGPLPSKAQFGSQ
jgi:hypothetical protein